MRAIDVHVHPMNPAYVQASLPFIAAAQRMFNGKFHARPDQQIAEDFRRDDALAIPIARDAEHGAAGGVYANEALAALKHGMQRRMQDKVLFGSDYPGWSPGPCCDEWEMEGFRHGVIEKLFYQNAIRILKLDGVVARAAAAGAET